MIKFTALAAYYTEEWSKKHIAAQEMFEEELERSQSMGTPPPPKPALEVKDEDVEWDKFTLLIRPSDIKFVTREGGKTYLHTVYHQNPVPVAHPIAKVHELLKSYSEK